MPRGYRYVILAAVAGLSLAGVAQGHHGKRQQAEGHAQPQQGITAAPVVEPSPSPSNSKAAQPECKDDRGADRDCTVVATDAYVQQARYAHWQALAAIAGVVAGFLTLGAACVAAYWAKRAAEETQRSADIAENAARDTVRALDIARTSADAALDAVSAAKAANDITVSAQRPWLSIDKFFGRALQGQMSDGTPVNGALSIHFDYVNTGISPAQRVSINRSFRTRPFGSDIPDFTNDIVDVGVGVVGPTRIGFATVSTFFDQQVAAFQRKETELWLCIVIRYTDKPNGELRYITEATACLQFNGITHDDHGGEVPMMSVTFRGPRNSMA